MATTTFKVAYVRCAAFYLRGFEKAMKPRLKIERKRVGGKASVTIWLDEKKIYNLQIIIRIFGCVVGCCVSEG